MNNKPNHRGISKKLNIPMAQKVESNTNKINKLIIPNIDVVKQRAKEPIVFSFVAFDRTHEAFNLGNACCEWYVSLFDALQEISNRSWGTLIQEKHFRAHNHDFHHTNYNYSAGETIDFEGQEEPVQFGLSKSKGRVSGFLLGNIFYVKWFDSEHNMNDSEGYGGVKVYDPAKNCIERMDKMLLELNEKNNKLTNENQELYKLLDEKTS